MKPEPDSYFSTTEIYQEKCVLHCNVTDLRKKKVFVYIIKLIKKYDFQPIMIVKILNPAYLKLILLNPYEDVCTKYAQMKYDTRS